MKRSDVLCVVIHLSSSFLFSALPPLILSYNFRKKQHSVYGDSNTSQIYERSLASNQLYRPNDNIHFESVTNLSEQLHNHEIQITVHARLSNVERSNRDLFNILILRKNFECFFTLSSTWFTAVSMVKTFWLLVTLGFVSISEADERKTCSLTKFFIVFDLHVKMNMPML